MECHLLLAAPVALQLSAEDLLVVGQHSIAVDIVY